MANFAGNKYVFLSSKGFKAFDAAIKAAIPSEDPLETYQLIKGKGKGEWTQSRHFGSKVLSGMWLMDYGEFNFKSKKSFDHRDLSGSDQTSTIEVTANKVVQTQVIGGQVEVTTTREFEGESMKVKMTSPTTDCTTTAKFKLMK